MSEGLFDMDEALRELIGTLEDAENQLSRIHRGTIPLEDNKAVPYFFFKISDYLSRANEKLVEYKLVIQSRDPADRERWNRSVLDLTNLF